jgi:rRNA maturation RNase YbeY
VEGEIYISADRADIHAREFEVSLGEEIGRLIIHGMLHLKGYDDQTENERQEMQQKEDFYLQKYRELVALL